MIKLAVIGDPIAHSMSPIIHTSVLNELGIEYEYQKLRVLRGELSSFIEYVKHENINGFNITMPHKNDIMGFLDEIDEEAIRYNSVNTVKFENGKLYGYNTDADGYILSLKEMNFCLKGKNVVILGSGSVVGTLALKSAYEKASSITILNRTESKAEAICNSVYSKTGVHIDFGNFEISTISRFSQKADLLINATPLGMHGVDSDYNDFDFFNYLNAGALVSDLIYNPKETNFLRNAKDKGFKTVNGLGMLMYQALIADRIYTGIDFDFIEMKSKISKKI